MLRRRQPLSSLDRLEREANNDFHLLAELGPEDFGMEHLLELRALSEQRLALFDRRQRLAMSLGGCAGGWGLLGFFSGFAPVIWVTVASYVLSGLCLTGFFALIVLQKLRYESRGELEFALRNIEDELHRRAAKKTV